MTNGARSLRRWAAATLVYAAGCAGRSSPSGEAVGRPAADVDAAAPAEAGEARAGRARSKVDPELLSLLDGPAAERPSELRVLMRLAREPSPEEVSLLKARGVRVVTAFGEIVTATLPLSRLEEIAALDLVMFIEAPSAVHPEAGSSDRSAPNASGDVEP